MAFATSTARTLAKHRYIQEDVTPWLAGWLSEKGRNSETATRDKNPARVSPAVKSRPAIPPYPTDALGAIASMSVTTSIKAGLPLARA